MNASDSSMGYYVEPLVDRERPRPLLMGFVALGGLAAVATLVLSFRVMS